MQQNYGEFVLCISLIKKIAPMTKNTLMLVLTREEDIPKIVEDN